MFLQRMRPSVSSTSTVVVIKGFVFGIAGSIFGDHWAFFGWSTSSYSQLLTD